MKGNKFTSFLVRYHSWFAMVFLPIAVFYAQECFTHNPWTTMYPEVQRFNWLLYLLFFWILFFLFGSTRIALMAGTILCGILGLTNYFVMEFRSSPIVPWDIFSLKTAISVAGDYDYSLELHAIFALAALLVLLVISYFCPSPFKNMKKSVRIGGLVLLTALEIMNVSRLHKDTFIRELRLDNTLFTPNVMARKNGMVTSFLMDLRYLIVSEPDGYDPEETAARLEEYSETTASVSDQQLPDIIVIMDEAFSDPAVLGDFTTNEDYMPFLHSLQEKNTGKHISGWLNVSVKGGNTANTEYEFLTGSTMRFLPSGSVPYQQYIFSEKPTLASWLRDLGYMTTSLHPFNSTGWNRNVVYPLFGFENILFNSAFTDPPRIRKYINDEACFDRIQQLLNRDREDDQPQFVFAVTMQNHSGYTETFDNFTPDISVDGLATVPSTNALINNYLSLMKITDEALEMLLEELSYSDHHTIVVFFGDHQPNDIVVEPIYRLNGTSSANLEAEELTNRYKVPYLIWSNYKMDTEGLDLEDPSNETSVNYLGALLLKLAGVPLSSAQQAILDIREDIPVISTQRLEADEESETLDWYRKLQYYLMNDAEQ